MLWTKGKYKDYTAFVVEVHVRKDSKGNVASFHCLQSPEDQQIVEGLEGSHGMAEGAWALLTEAARAEILLQLLVKLSKGLKIDETTFEELSQDTLKQMEKGLGELLPHLVREVVGMVKNGLQNKTG